MDFWHWLAFVVIAGALVLASPKIVEQACSEEEEEYVHPEDAWCSGATPDCPSHYEAWNTLPPTTN